MHLKTASWRVEIQYECRCRVRQRFRHPYDETQPESHLRLHRRPMRDAVEVAIFAVAAIVQAWERFR